MTQNAIRNWDSLLMDFYIVLYGKDHIKTQQNKQANQPTNKNPSTFKVPRSYVKNHLLICKMEVDRWNSPQRWKLLVDASFALSTYPSCTSEKAGTKHPTVTILKQAGVSECSVLFCHLVEVEERGLQQSLAHWLGQVSINVEFTCSLGKVSKHWEVETPPFVGWGWQVQKEETFFHSSLKLVHTLGQGTQSLQSWRPRKHAVKTFFLLLFWSWQVYPSYTFSSCLVKASRHGQSTWGCHLIA